MPLAPTASTAHEYWIVPDKFSVNPGERVQARLLVGEMMEGAELPWLSHQIRSFSVATPGGIIEPEGAEGDLPALSYIAVGPGLHVMALETIPLQVTFDTLEEFEEYLAYEGLASAVDEHRRRGLPETAITEAYARSAKALVQVGPARPDDADRPLGLAFEFVALGNPYAAGEFLPVRLTWQGRPEVGAQISIFEKNAEVSRSIVVTDADGRAQIPLTAGTEVLLNAVHLKPVDGEEHVWQSTWASLSFGVVSHD